MKPTEPVTLVVGATGLLGHAICGELRRRGQVVRALVRSIETIARPLPPGCDPARGDLKQPATLALACQGATAVVTTANAMLSRRAGDSLARVDRDGTRSLVAAARAAGVQHFVYTSVSPTLPADNDFVRYKRELEDVVRGSGMTWTILQPTAFMEVHTGRLAGWDFVRGRARIAGSGTAPISLVSVSDVAAIAAESAHARWAVNRAIPIGGPEALSPREAVAVAERVTGRRFTVRRLPTPALPVMAAVTRSVHPPLSSLFRMLLATGAGDVVDMANLLADYPMQLTRFEDYVRRALLEGGDRAGAEAGFSGPQASV